MGPRWCAAVLALGLSGGVLVGCSGDDDGSPSLPADRATPGTLLDSEATSAKSLAGASVHTIRYASISGLDGPCCR